MKNLILTLIITLPLILWGQGWEQTYGGTNTDEGWSVQQTLDGGYIITGTTFSFGNGSSDIYLMKTDGSGNEQWNQTFGGTGSEMGKSVQQTTDGGYIITGTTTSFGNGMGDVYLIKTDENGNEQWHQTFGGTNTDEGWSVQQVSFGGYIITGKTRSFGNGLQNLWLIKTDDNGIEQWSRTFGGFVDDWGVSVQQTTDAGYIITGTTYSYVNNSTSSYGDLWLIKTDLNGFIQYSNAIGGMGSEYGYSVQQTTDGGYIIAGKFSNQSVGGGSNGDADVWLIKAGTNCQEVWTKTFGGSGYDCGYSVQQTTDGGYIITGTTFSFGNGNSDIYLIKTDGSGNEQWNQTFGGTGSEMGNSVQQTTDGGYIITGIQNSTVGVLGVIDIILIKTNQFGNITSTFEVPLPNPNRKVEKTINLKGQEIKSQTNTPIIEIFDDGSVEKKLIIEK